MSNLRMLKPSSGGDGVSVRMRFLAGLASLVMVMLMLTAPVGTAGGRARIRWRRRWTASSGPSRTGSWHFRYACDKTVRYVEALARLR